MRAGCLLALLLLGCSGGDFVPSGVAGAGMGGDEPRAGTGGSTGGTTGGTGGNSAAGTGGSAGGAQAGAGGTTTAGTGGSGGDAGEPAAGTGGTTGGTAGETTGGAGTGGSEPQAGAPPMGGAAGVSMAGQAGASSGAGGTGGAGASGMAGMTGTAGAPPSLEPQPAENCEGFFDYYVPVGTCIWFQGEWTFQTQDCDLLNPSEEYQCGVVDAIDEERWYRLKPGNQFNDPVRYDLENGACPKVCTSS